MYCEFDEVIGCKCFFSFMDKKNFFYLEVILVEVLCFRLLVLLGFFYKVLVDIILNGYNIFKDIILIVNLWVIYYDFKYWESFIKFDFNRFLDNNGNVLNFVFLSYLFFLVGR